jgi:hypothetical protein
MALPEVLDAPSADHGDAQGSLAAQAGPKARAE